MAVRVLPGFVFSSLTKFEESCLLESYSCKKRFKPARRVKQNDVAMVLGRKLTRDARPQGL